MVLLSPPSMERREVLLHRLNPMTAVMFSLEGQIALLLQKGVCFILQKLNGSSKSSTSVMAKTVNLTGLESPKR